MSSSAKIEQVRDMHHKLHVYDVEQRGWEHEGLGLEVNARHVLTHLAKDIVNKDFDDEELVKEAIAPDLAQYALRLCRWSDSHPYGLLETENYDKEAYDPTSFTKYYEKDKTGILRAIGGLASVLHDIDHAKSSSDAREALPSKAVKSAKFLFDAASFQAATMDFDLSESFDLRLSQLRQRFKIPDPTK